MAAVATLDPEPMPQHLPEPYPTPMSEPYQILYVAAEAPDLWGSAFGPFVVEHCATLAEAAAQLAAQRHDAVVIAANTPAPLLAWPGLPMAVLQSAVLVLSPEPDAAVATRLLQLGVQDVLPPCDALALGRVLRLAIERKRLELAARRAYSIDLSTGLPNHAQLMEHMTHLLALREREPAVMALLAIAVEGLAATEARLGAEAANVLRRKVAVRLRSGLRASDVVASLGGDSFCVLLAWIDGADDGEHVAVKLAQSLQRPFSVAGQDVAVAVRTGVARYPDQGKEAAALLRRALGQAGDAQALGRAGLTPRGAGAAANDD